MNNTPAPGFDPNPSEPAFRTRDPIKGHALKRRLVRWGVLPLTPAPEKLEVSEHCPAGVQGGGVGDRPWGGAGEAKRKRRAGGRSPANASPFHSGGQALP